MFSDSPIGFRLEYGVHPCHVAKSTVLRLDGLIGLRNDKAASKIYVQSDLSLSTEDGDLAWYVALTKLLKYSQTSLSRERPRQRHLFSLFLGLFSKARQPLRG